MSIPITNNPMITLATLALSVFLAGSFFGGDFRYRQELKEEIKEVKAEQAVVLQQVKEANERYQRQQLEFNQKTVEFYKTLESITAQKQDVTKKLRDLEPKIVEQRKKVELEVAVLEKILDNNKIEFEKK